MSAPIQGLQAAVASMANKLKSALFWTTDTGRLYIAESNGQQWPVSGMELHEFTFTETDGVDSTYTATLVVPAGYTVYDVLVGSTVVWNAATSASLVVGDADDPNGYIEATDVKTTPAAEVNGGYKLNLEIAADAYRGGRYYAAEGLITMQITTDDDGTHHAGRTRIAVLMAPGARTVTAATKAAV